MTEELDPISRLQKRIEHYETLAETYAKKAEALKLAVRELGGDIEPPSSLDPKQVAREPYLPNERIPDDLELKTIPEGVRIVLLQANRPLRTNDILKRLERGGKDVSINGLRSVLYGRDNKGRFQKVGKGVWWLADKPIDRT